MSSSSVTETKNNLSAIIATLNSGAEQEHIIRNRNVPVGVIRPYVEHSQSKPKFGFAKNDTWDIDWDVFDALDTGILEDMRI